GEIHKTPSPTKLQLMTTCGWVEGIRVTVLTNNCVLFVTVGNHIEAGQFLKETLQLVLLNLSGFELQHLLH
ncbi:MAG: hypothetical protein ACKPKO_17325, partial [Candidatus Fonsibacter sp.]